MHVKGISKCVFVLGCQWWLLIGQILTGKTLIFPSDLTLSFLVWEHPEHESVRLTWPSTQCSTPALTVCLCPNVSQPCRKTLWSWCCWRWRTARLSPGRFWCCLWCRNWKQRFPQASKTSIGHVVQLLYRASCFKVRAKISFTQPLHWSLNSHYSQYSFYVD